MSLGTPFPYAPAPDIIRAHQKDSYFHTHLSTSLISLHRRIISARSAHEHTPTIRALSHALYLTLTTLLTARTLGEEYVDVVQLYDSGGPGDSARPASRRRRAAHVLATTLLPYTLSRFLPSLRTRLLHSLERRAALASPDSRKFRILNYIISHLTTPQTLPTAVKAIWLAWFYFSGTYYEFSKKLLGLRYVFTHKVPDTPDRGGYEVLGVLLVVQMAVQGYLHLREALTAEEDVPERLGKYGTGEDVSLDEDSHSANMNLLISDVQVPGQTALGERTAGPRYDLRDEKTMTFISGTQQRKCTLCLEELKDPSAMQCGHVYCWECICDWVREKPECPLCRRETRVQHILPLRTV